MNTRTKTISARGGWGLTAPAVCVLALLAAAPAAALDVFTLWSRPEVPLKIEPGDWADYRTQEMAAGRRSTDLVRIRCLAADAAAWTLELRPLTESAGGVLDPDPGRGLRLEISRALASREGDLADHVLKVEQIRDGAYRELPSAEWREDPLVRSSLKAGFVPDRVDTLDGTVRVVAGAELACGQLELASADTTRIAMPKGELVQVHGRVVTAAVHRSVPFLGIVYAAEREETRSSIVPEGGRRCPPPEIGVEIMELIGFGGEDGSEAEGVDPRNPSMVQ